MNIASVAMYACLPGHEIMTKVCLDACHKIRSDISQEI